MKTHRITLLLLLYFLVCYCKGGKMQPDEESLSRKINSPIEMNSLFEDVMLNNIFVFKSSMDSVELKALINDDYTFILYFAQNACMDCIHRTFGIISEVSVQKMHNIIGLTDFLDARIIRTIMIQYGFEFPFYSTLINDLGFSGNEFSGPYIFVLDKSLKIKKIVSTSDASKEAIVNLLINI
jgi:hypothetical protein